MDEKILKHLDFVQNTINRMSTNSFIIKGWTITLIAVIFSLNKLEGNYLFTYSDYNFPTEIVVIIFLILLFWFTNAYFLQQERRYIYIYSKLIEQYNSSNSNNLILDMNYKNYISSSKSKLTDKKRKLILNAIVALWVIGIIISLLFFESTFLKIICPIFLTLISVFTLTYFISVKHNCQFWACLVGRTIVSIYGILIVLVLFINHSMFNTGVKKDLNNEKCECVIKHNK